MTPKKRILILSGVFGTVGFLFSIIIIAINGGFSGDGPSILNPPTSEDLWSIGSNIADGMNLTYSLTSTGELSSLSDSIVSMKFSDIRDKWNVYFKIKNGSTIKEINMNLSKEQLVAKDSITEEQKKFIQPIERSIFVIRDLAREPKYLVVGAVWDKISTGSSTIDVKITTTDTISTSTGNFKVYVLEYQVGNSKSKIYLNKDLPFPIKAEVFDENNKRLYDYELIDIKM